MIARFNKHLMKVFAPYKSSVRIMEFKEEMLGSLMERYNELKGEGFSDEESYNKSLVILDGIGETIEQLKKETNYTPPVDTVINKYLLPACIYWMALISIYLIVSFATRRFDITWVVIVAGALVFAVLMTVSLSKVTKRKGLKILSRGNLFLASMCASTILYLAWSFISKKWAYTWIIFIIGILIWYILDIYERVRKEDNKAKLGLFDAIVITVLSTLIIYILISFIFSMWATSWIIFVLMVLLIIIEIMLFNRKQI